jgi:hypothetical protein
MGAPALLLKKRACAGTGPIKTGTDLVGVRFCSTLFIILRLAQIVNITTVVLYPNYAPTRVILDVFRRI